MGNTLNKNLLTASLSDAFDLFLETKKVRIADEIVPLGPTISYILFPSDKNEVPLGFESYSEFQGAMGFRNQYEGALIFNEDGDPKLYSSIGGILYAVWT